MTDNDDSTPKVESRLDALGEDVGVLKDDVRVLKDDVRVLKQDVQKFRVLYEEHDTKINTIIEVQGHHTDVLDEIRVAVAPLRDIDDFMKRIGHDHERRIDALEQRTGLTPRS